MPPVAAEKLLEKDVVKRKNCLVAFDCDHTLLDVDSDEAVAALVPELPSRISTLFDGHCWIDYMNAVYEHLHKNDVNIECIQGAFKRMPFVKGIPDLFQDMLCDPNIQLLIISDANDFGIGQIVSRLCENCEPIPCIPVITNKACLTPTGQITLQCYDRQGDCSICPWNLCKGKALREFLRQNGPYEKVVYIGDGKNDVCPALCLSKTDCVMARRGYKLHQQLLGFNNDMTINCNGTSRNLQAEVHIWDNGFDIAKHFSASKLRPFTV